MSWPNDEQAIKRRFIQEMPSEVAETSSRAETSVTVPTASTAPDNVPASGEVLQRVGPSHNASYDLTGLGAGFTSFIHGSHGHKEVVPLQKWLETENTNTQTWPELPSVNTTVDGHDNQAENFFNSPDLTQFDPSVVWIQPSGASGRGTAVDSLDMLSFNSMDIAYSTPSRQLSSQMKAPQDQNVSLAEPILEVLEREQEQAGQEAPSSNLSDHNQTRKKDTLGNSDAQASIIGVAHFPQASSSEKASYCPTCFKPFKRLSELSKHEKSHMDRKRRPHACHICGNRFNYPKDLKRHQSAKHAQPGEAMYCCTEATCKDLKCFRRKDKLLQHIAKEHPTLRPTASLAIEERTYDPSLSESEYILTHAPKFSDRLSDEPNHYFSGTEGENEQRSSASFVLDRPALAHEAALDQPDHAMRLTLPNNDADGDKSTQTAKSKHKCEICKAEFVHMYDLRRHERTLHQSDDLERPQKRFKCAAKGCRKVEKVWTRLDNFKRHVDKNHPKEDVKELIQKSEAKGASTEITFSHVHEELASGGISESLGSDGLSMADSGTSHPYSTPLIDNDGVLPDGWILLHFDSSFPGSESLTDAVPHP